MRSMEGLPTYSTLEVSKNASPENAWVIIAGKVLDITAWLEEHPGGDDVLLALAGKSIAATKTIKQKKTRYLQLRVPTVCTSACAFA